MSTFKQKREQERLIQMTEQGMEQLIAERHAKIQMFLNENANSATIENSAINAVVLAEVQHGGVPSIEEQPVMLERCLALASKISAAQLRRKWEGFRDCLADQKVGEAPPHLIWAARKAGVDLFPETEAAATVIAEH